MPEGSRWNLSHPCPFAFDLFTTRAFILEALANIPGVEEVVLSSEEHIHWFAQCLALRIRGEGGELKPLEWRMQTIKSHRWKDDLTKAEEVTVTTWKVGLPTLDWMEFAQRNGIAIPPGAERKYFPKR